MRLLGYLGRLLGCCYAVARVTRVWFAIRLLWYSGWLLGVATRLLWYPGWLLRCCYAVAKVPGLVARVLLRSC